MASTAVASKFPGFPPEAIKFLSALKRHNDREWFQPRKEQYERFLKAPMLELLALLNADLAAYAPQYVTDPKKAMFRIYRDTRFSSDKTPYKTNVSAVFKTSGIMTGGLYFSISPKEIEIAAGVYHADRDAILAIRQYIAEHEEELRAILADRKARRLCGDLKGDELARMPKGFDPAHSAADLIRKKDWLLDVTLEPEIATTPSLFDEIRKRFRAMFPFAEFMSRAAAPKKKQQAAFFAL